MAIITTGNTFADGDQVTSTKLNNIANAATWDEPADDLTIEVNSGNKLQVKTISTPNIAALSVTTAKLADSTSASDGVTDAKLRHSAGLSVVGRGSNSTGTVADLVAGTDAHVLRRSGTSVGFGQITPASLTQWMTSGTAQTATGTSVNFTSIPDWVKRITILFSGVSVDSATVGWPLIQIGDAGGIETTGYTGYLQDTYYGIGSQFTNGYRLYYSSAAATAATGTATISLIGTNTWIYSLTSCSNVNGDARLFYASGVKQLSATLDRLSIIPHAGNFDAGTINIIYE